MGFFGKSQLPPESGWERGTYSSSNLYSGYEEASDDDYRTLKHAARAKGGHFEVHDGKIHLYVGRAQGTFDDCIGGMQEALRCLREM